MNLNFGKYNIYGFEPFQVTLKFQNMSSFVTLGIVNLNCMYCNIVLPRTVTGEKGEQSGGKQKSSDGARGH